MAKNKRNKKNKALQFQKSKLKNWQEDLHPETKKGILAIIFFALAIIFVLAYVGKGGSAGSIIYEVLNYLLGKGYFFVPLSFILMGYTFLTEEKRKFLGTTLLGGLVFIISSLTLLAITFSASSGGEIGDLIAIPLLKAFDFWASLVIAGGVFVISIVLMMNIPLRISVSSEDNFDEEASTDSIPIIAAPKKDLPAISAVIEKDEGQNVIIEPIIEEKLSENSNDNNYSKENDFERTRRKINRTWEYKMPPLDLLNGDRGTPSSGDIRANSNIIKLTLQNFGIDVEMGEVSVGPTVTRYTFRPAEGVKLSRIIALQNDLALALAAHPIRLEAPIPGKSLVGIEVPNRSISLVGLRSLLEDKIFRTATNPLLIALGRDVAGVPIYADIAKMPHILISGATGAGKSVCVHSFLTSLLYRNPPQLLRLIIVDPKRVELSIYNDVPHLLTPVITDSKKTIQALNWATREMDRRYELLSHNKARDIASYNASVMKDSEAELLPYTVIVIDELADLMSTYPREVEAAIIRLAQMARAVGIHLIVATQRPSVDVITGLIKANITTRIAFQVASQTDSRTVLDMGGAEKLLGNGDMLFLSGDSGKPKRVQGAFVSEEEVKRVTKYIKEEMPETDYDSGVLENKIDERESAGEYNGDSDPLYEEAKDMVLIAGKASASYLQRRLRVGYARAARLLDLLEAEGIIGPSDGAKPREVLGSGTVLDEKDYEA